MVTCFLVGVSGFEPEASWTRTKRDTKLRHTPITSCIIVKICCIVKCWDDFFQFRMERECDSYTDRGGIDMSYCVEYNPESKKRYPSVKTKQNKLKIKMMLLLLFFSVVVYTAVRCDLVYYLIPGQPDVTVAAVSGLVDQIKAGEPMGEAVQCFMETVIQNGE